MKKTGFHIYFVVYLIALALSAGSATILKVFSTNPATGFVEIGSFPFDFVLVYLFRLSLILPILFWFFITIRRRAKHDFPISYRHISSGILSILTGLSMIGYTLFSLGQQIIKPENAELIVLQGKEMTSKLLLVFIMIFGIMGGISMIVGGVRPRYGVWGKPGVMLGFFPALWQLVVLMARFNGFVAITTIIDVTLVILFMCFAGMFLIGQSRIIFGLGIRNGKTYAIPAGLSVSLIGLTFIISNGIYAVVHGGFLPNLDISIFETIYILCLSVYSVVFLAGYSRSIRVV